MIAYTSQELLSSSDFTKKFGTYLAQLKTDVVDIIAIFKNNNIEAVLVTKKDYKAMKRAWELQEHREIYEIVEKRKETPKEAYVSFDDMAKRLNIDADAL